jgi:diguanylate cyclase (GGDEF)-like protein/PAS domain S-box-containing protein
MLQIVKNRADGRYGTMGAVLLALAAGVCSERSQYSLRLTLALVLLALLLAAAAFEKQRQLLHKLRQSESMYRFLVESSADTITRINLDGVRTYVSPAIQDLLGWNPEEITGQCITDITHPDDATSIIELLERAKKHGWQMLYVLRMRKKSGEYLWVEANLRVIVDAEEKPVELVSTIRDVHERVIREGQLVVERRQAMAMAGNDGLTGLANRYNLDVEIASAWSTICGVGGEIACILLDVDYFKMFNDNYGHPEGDECLRMIAFAIAQGIRGKEDFAARYGGEEFCVLLRHGNMKKAMVVAERIRAEVEKFECPHMMSPCGHVTVSVGVATSRSPGVKNYNQLLSAADRALYRAKQNGKNCIAQADEEVRLTLAS